MKLKSKLRKESQTMLSAMDESIISQLQLSWKYFESLVSSLFPAIPIPNFEEGFARYLFFRINEGTKFLDLENKFSDLQLDYLYAVLQILEIDPQ